MPILYVPWIPAERPPQPPLGINILTGLPFREGTHRNFHDLLRDIRGFATEHQAAGRRVRVLAADDPRDLQIGYTAFTETDPEWSLACSIAMQDLKFSLDHDFSPEEQGLLRTALRNQAGRATLAVSMIAGVPTAEPDSPRA